MERKQGGPGVGDHMCECVEGRGQREVREGSMRDVVRETLGGLEYRIAVIIVGKDSTPQRDPTCQVEKWH